MPLESNADKAYMNGLPKVSFRVLTEDSAWLQPAGVQSEQSRSYGYNDFSDFEKPEHYIRYIEPIESELSVQVEYDMDEQDQAWLDIYNAERTKEQCGPISYEAFEIVMDKLEKEWFNLSKRIPQPQQHLPAEDSKCAICDDGEGENSNAIVFCDGCNLAVHQDCYGVPYIPEGQWLCRKCTVSPDKPVSCIFCPNEGGAFKQTSTSHWAHLLCAIWIPETSLGNAIYMEPVEGVEHIPKNRWKLVCSLCKEKGGACIQCDNRNCFTAFHVTCARQLGLLQTMKSLTTDGVLRAFCHKHLPVEERIEDESDEYFEEVENWYTSPAPNFLKSMSKPQSRLFKASSKAHTSRKMQPMAAPLPVTKKSAQAHSKSFRPGPPIVPKIIVDKVLEYIGKIQLRKKNAAVERICRYWSLKREARRGAPLLKRLHLEPWTASNSGKIQSAAEKAQKLKFLQMLRNDLEKVRMLAELVRKREKEKLRQVQVINDIVTNFIFPLSQKLRVILERIFALDRRELFLNPVTETEAPHYFDIIKEPMCWLYIDEKLEKNVYIDVAEFKRDVHLVIGNAMLYNAKDTPFHRAAARLKTSVEPLLAELNDNIVSYEKTEPESTRNDWPVGDLEPALHLLLTFFHSTPVPSLPNEPQDMLSSLFANELPPPKSPTPTPPPKSEQRKRETAEERRKRLEEREAAAMARGPTRTTRASEAKSRAFAEDAGVSFLVETLAPENDVRGSEVGLDEEGRSVRRSMRTSLGGDETFRTKPKRDSVAQSRGDSKRTDETSSTDIQISEQPQEHSLQNKDWLPSTIRPPTRHQPGVIGIETLRLLSDKERRELERSMEIKTKEVNQAEEFKRFNVGWVLPEGSKRRRSSEAGSQASVTSSIVPQSLKTLRTSGASTRAKTSPAPTMESDKLKKTSGDIDVIQEEEGEEENGIRGDSRIDMDSNIESDARRGDKENAESDLSSPPTSPITQMPRKGIRTMRPVEDNANSELKASSSTEANVESSARAQTRKAENAEIESEIPRAVKRIKGQTLSKREMGAKGDKKHPPSPTPNRKSRAKDPYPPRTLVYSFPYFPAEIVNIVDDRDKIPPAVLAQESRAREDAKKAKSRLWLVQFFDNKSSYGWIMETKLDDLGVDEKVDALYLAGKDRYGNGRGFKSKGLRKACRKGYRDAIASMLSNVEGDEQD
ncbi:uncharacterized protein L203_103135 [Cryptococcus depauperatus CBS 7841]|uniref:NuA3 HAT complex component NTO1 n=1 Tax=Cryptococcus depauperatus CBS 7841 TaxID=1295531 RepID=A0AAJ8JT47_9TREE